jgi:hypothetical protein
MLQSGSGNLSSSMPLCGIPNGGQPEPRLSAPSKTLPSPNHLTPTKHQGKNLPDEPKLPSTKWNSQTLGTRDNHQASAISSRGCSLRGLAMSANADSHVRGFYDPILHIDVVAKCGISHIPQLLTPLCRVLACHEWPWPSVR